MVVEGLVDHVPLPDPPREGAHRLPNVLLDAGAQPRRGGGLALGVHLGLVLGAQRRGEVAPAGPDQVVASNGERPVLRPAQEPGRGFGHRGLRAGEERPLELVLGDHHGEQPLDGRGVALAVRLREPVAQIRDVDGGAEPEAGSRHGDRDLRAGYRRPGDVGDDDGELAPPMGLDPLRRLRPPGGVRLPSLVRERRRRQRLGGRRVAVVGQSQPAHGQGLRREAEEQHDGRGPGRAALRRHERQGERGPLVTDGQGKRQRPRVGVRVTLEDQGRPAPILSLRGLYAPRLQLGVQEVTRLDRRLGRRVQEQVPEHPRLGVARDLHGARELAIGHGDGADRPGRGILGRVEEAERLRPGDDRLGIAWLRGRQLLVERDVVDPQIDLAVPGLEEPAQLLGRREHLLDGDLWAPAGLGHGREGHPHERPVVRDRRRVVELVIAVSRQRVRRQPPRAVVGLAVLGQAELEVEGTRAHRRLGHELYAVVPRQPDRRRLGEGAEGVRPQPGGNPHVIPPEHAPRRPGEAGRVPALPVAGGAGGEDPAQEGALGPAHGLAALVLIVEGMPLAAELVDRVAVLEVVDEQDLGDPLPPGLRRAAARHAGGGASGASGARGARSARGAGEGSRVPAGAAGRARSGRHPRARAAERDDDETCRWMDAMVPG